MLGAIISPISRLLLFSQPPSAPGRDRHVCPLTFCTKFNSQQLLFEQFFYIIGNFCGVQPESESTFPFQYAIMFTDALV